MSTGKGCCVSWFISMIISFDDPDAEKIHGGFIQLSMRSNFFGFDFRPPEKSFIHWDPALYF